MTDRSGRDRRQAGKRQRGILRALGSHGVWTPGCGWGAGAADCNTEGVLRTLVLRGEVTTDAAPGRAPSRWWLTALGYSWLVHDAAHDGNTPQAEYARVLKGIEDGDPEVMDTYREFAGDYSEDQLMADAGWVPHDGTDLRDELAEQYNSEVSAAFWHEVERLANSGAGTCGDCGCSK